MEEEDCQQLSETTREENYQTAADCNLSCSGRESGHRVVKCHRYDGYFRVKMLAGGVKVSFLLVLSNSGAKTVTIYVFFREKFGLTVLLRVKESTFHNSDRTKENQLSLLMLPMLCLPQALKGKGDGKGGSKRRAKI